MLLVLPRDAAETVGKLAFGVGPFVLSGGAGAWYWWSRSGRQKIVISVANDGLTVSTRPGDVYSFSGAKLGTWGQTGGMTMGTALHLQCGPRRFVLGGRDRRAAAGTRLDAPDVVYGFEVDVDAHLPTAEFEEVLALVGGPPSVFARGGLDVRPPAPGDPKRCLLFTNPLLVQEFGAFQYRKRNEFMQSLSQPRLAIDLGPDAIWVIDPNTNAVIASVWPPQVRATPVVFRPRQSFTGDLMGRAMADYWSTALGMHVNIPGMQPLTISCRDSVSGLDNRFSWPTTYRPKADAQITR